VDPWFIANAAPQKSKLIQTARAINDDKPEWVIEKVKSKINTLSAETTGPDKVQTKIVCFGLAFKANIDDFRESPALYIARKLAEQYIGQVYVVEPNIDTSSSKNQELFTYISYEEAIDLGDVLVLLVDHDEFKEFRPAGDNSKIIVDTRGIWSN
jgi:UDP-N-acetyl-D-mannosaminuronic acid dehydrogenase